MVPRRTRVGHRHAAGRSRYPPVGLFDAVADPADLDVVFEIEAIGNPRLRERGRRAVAGAARPSASAAPGTTPIMSAFTHLNPEGSRFPTARTVCITRRTTSRPRSRRSATTAPGSSRAPRNRRSTSTCAATASRCARSVVDLRGNRAPAGILDPASYAAARVRARPAGRGEPGIVHDSVDVRWSMRSAVHPEGDRTDSE